VESWWPSFVNDEVYEVLDRVLPIDHSRYRTTDTYREIVLIARIMDAIFEQMGPNRAEPDAVAYCESPLEFACSSADGKEGRA
jgi:hypothetical protein